MAEHHKWALKLLESEFLSQLERSLLDHARSGRPLGADEAEFQLKDDLNLAVQRLRYIEETLLCGLEPDEFKFQRWVDEAVAGFVRRAGVSLSGEKVHAQANMRGVETVNYTSVLSFDAPIELTHVDDSVRYLDDELVKHLEDLRSEAPMGEVVDTEVQERYEVEVGYEVHHAVDHAQGNKP